MKKLMRWDIFFAAISLALLSYSVWLQYQAQGRELHD